VQAPRRHHVRAAPAGCRVRRERLGHHRRARTVKRACQLRPG
jgi:hypothetical protein